MKFCQNKKGILFLEQKNKTAFEFFFILAVDL